jgi:putative transposase
MPRGPRLDAPHVLHHVMVRGLERRVIFRNDIDRTDLVARVAVLAEAGAWTVYAWALLPNHAHLLVRTGARSLPRSMRSLLTGYAGAFNRRHHRVGHLFQNRYKSIVVEEEPYLLELVRYLHLNPVRAGVVEFRALDRYAWTGHSALLGKVPRPWQETQTILAQFGSAVPSARRAYRAFLADGVAQGRRPELQGGGLVRSAGGWEALVAQRRANETEVGDARVLGGGEFVEQLRREVAAARPAPVRESCPLDAVVARVCAHTGATPTALAGGSRRTAEARAREGIAYLWVTVLGRSGRRLTPVLGVAPQSVYRAAARGVERCAELLPFLAR